MNPRADKLRSRDHVRAKQRTVLDEQLERLSPRARAAVWTFLGLLAEIQKATVRLAAIRQAGSMSAGAAYLGISHVGMLKWLRTHNFPAGLAGS